MIPQAQFDALLRDLKRLWRFEPILRRELHRCLAGGRNKTLTRSVLYLGGPDVEYVRAAARAVVRHRLYVSREFGVPSTIVLFRDGSLGGDLLLDLFSYNHVLAVHPNGLQPARRSDVLAGLMRAEVAKGARRAAKLLHESGLSDAVDWDDDETRESEDSDDEDELKRRLAPALRAGEIFCERVRASYQGAWNRYWWRGLFPPLDRRADEDRNGAA